MTRYWMTGCMALVLLAAGRASVRESAGDATSQRQDERITLTSRLSLDQAIAGLESVARTLGMSVMAKVPPDVPGAAEGAAVGQEQVVVLGDEGGLTPIVQPATSNQKPQAPQLPWAIRAVARHDGGTDFWVDGRSHPWADQLMQVVSLSQSSGLVEAAPPGGAQASQAEGDTT